MIMVLQDVLMSKPPVLYVNDEHDVMDRLIKDSDWFPETSDVC